MLKLSIQDSEGRSTLVPLTGGELSIGRDKSNVICLTDRNVSRHHARLVVKDDRVVLENTQATYGTRLNNLLIRDTSEVRSGDVIEVGDYKLEIVSDAPKDTAQRDSAGAASGAADSATGKSRAAEGATSVVNVGALQNSLDEADRATALPESQQPRLVVESENLRGLELRVERTPTVLGRVAESADLIVDHRSISKEHARLTRQSDGSWQVLDLGSANGMRVNGEAYSKCALSHGDRLELGHVILRFEAPGSMAGAVQSSNGNLLTNKPLLIGIAILAILAIAAVIALLRSGDPAPAATEGSVDSPAAETGAAPVAAGATDQAAAAPAEAQPTAETLESALAKVDALYKAGLLTEAKDAAAAVVAQFPGKAQAEARSRLVEIALDVQKTLDRAREQVPVAPAEAIALATAAQGRMDDDSPKALRDAAAQIIADANAALEAIRLAAPTGLVKTGIPVKAKASGDTPPSTGTVRPVTPTPPAAVTKPEPPKPVVAEPTAKPVEPEEKGPEPEAAAEPARKTGQMLYKEARDKVLAGDEEGGLSLYKQALAAGYAKSHGQLAKLYFGKGDKAGCARHAKAYLERYPDAGDAPQMQTLLEKCQ